MSSNESGRGERDLHVLQSKRDASRYQILVAIADRQPAVSQQEIADTVGITAQAVSEYVQDLRGMGYINTPGRGRYEVTKEGVDWLISRTDDLREYTQFVTEEVIGQVESETALATDDIAAGDRVTLSMEDGTLHASLAPETRGEGATAVATTTAVPGQDIGVAEFEGIYEYDIGTVRVFVVPDIKNGGSYAVDSETIEPLAAESALLTVAGTEALALANAAGITPDIRFGTAHAVPEAAARGLSVLLLVTERELASHTERLRENGVSYELVDPRE